MGAGEPDPPDALDRRPPPAAGRRRGAGAGSGPARRSSRSGRAASPRSRPAGPGRAPRPPGRRCGRETSPPAHRGDDAERTGVVAPGLDGHPCRVGKVPHRGQSATCWSPVAGSEDGSGSSRISTTGPDDGRLPQQRRRPGQIVGAEHHVHVGGTLADALLVHLGQATAHRDLHVGPALAQGLEVAQMRRRTCCRRSPGCSRC